METKYLIIIACLAIAVCVLAGALFGTMTKSVEYERIELTSNGTTIEIPTEKANYDGEVNGTGARLWSFKQGSLMSYNSQEATNNKGLYGLGGAIGMKSIRDIVLTHFEKREEIDGFTVYKLNGEQLGINNRSTLYCIIMGNDTTHDNIIITVDDKDIALHMAKSVQYKSSNSNASSNSAAVTNSNNNNSKSGLIPVAYDDGSVEYFHVGDIVSRPNGYFRVNSDGSLTKVANDPTSYEGSSEYNSQSSVESSSDSSSGSIVDGGQSDGAYYFDVGTSIG
ncbi:hypothetical protein [Methanobrevibacter sp.]|uniref:hypothetical protein n=1 Tax=Methanobrevibacter sp. TaxID=66852 RepID=UPI0038655F86